MKVEIIDLNHTGEGIAKIDGKVIFIPKAIPKDIVTIKEINKAIIIIELILAPNIIIIIGPKATFGKLLITVKYGSTTLYTNSLYQRIIAATVPNTVAKEKLINVSYTVTHICLNKFPSK